MEALILKAQGTDAENAEYIVVDQSPFRVGRRPENHAQIAQSDVSGAHAEFRFERDNWCLVDQRSTNGTFVNGKRIAGNVTLNVGDILHFATKGYQIVPRIEPKEGFSETKVLPDSSEIKGTMDLVHIINDQKTFPVYQPIIDLATDETVGWESLGRAFTSEGLVSPGTLFWFADQNKVQSKLSRRLSESAQFCAECRHCWTTPRGSFLFFNLHAAELVATDFLDWLDRFSRCNLRKWYQLVIEIPESLVCNTEEMQRLVREIRKRGVLVAYDDFGAGQSRIPDLISVPPDFLKLDRQLIASIGSNRIKKSLVKAIVDACVDLHVRTIGEGIETYDELEACTELQIDLGQGFLLFRPQRAYELFGADISTLPDHCPFVRFRLL